MKALHSAKYGRFAKHNVRKGGQHGRRLVSLLLCLCMVVSMMCNFGGWVLSSAAAAEATKYAMDRIADYDTTDSYVGKLLSSDWGSRYAGRVWTDKSVFAYADGKNMIDLDMETDGYNGKVGFNADFAHVFSALASSQVVNEYPPAPIDLVIAVDMSASMAQDTRCSINTLLDPTSDNSYTQNYGPEERTMAKRIENSRIQKTLDAINETIDALMKQNKENRVSVVVYGAGAAVLMPLAHYARVGERPYLTVGGMETLYTPDDLICDNTHGWVWTRNIDACYTVVANAMKSDADNPTFAGEPFKNSVSNNIDNSKPKSAVVDGKTYTEKVVANPGYATWENVDPAKDKFSEAQQELKADTYVGYFTNTQGGIYLAYAQLARSEKVTFTAKMSTGDEVTVARIPAAIIMSDGGANFAFNKMDTWSENYGDFGADYFGDWKASPYYRDDDAGDVTDYSHRLAETDIQIGDEWYNVYLPGVEDGNKITSLYNKGALATTDGTLLSGGNTLSSAPAWNNAGVFYSTDGTPFGTSGTVLETLLTAAYMRYVTETHYENGWDAGSATKESRSDLLTYTMSVDSENVPQWGKMRLYPSLDPATYSLDSTQPWWTDDEKFGTDEGIGSGYTKDAVYQGMLSSWQNWKSGSRTQAQFVERRGYIEPLPTDGYNDVRFGNIKVTNQDVINNISYADDFYDIDTGEVVVKFQEILSEITSNIFVPISGDNDAGVGDSITYQDPLGEYMELKNGAITVENGMVTGSSEKKTFDMSMLLFGEMHGLVRAGVYDYQWNYDYMHNNETKEGYPDDAGRDPNNDPLEIGWYKGDAKNAIYSYVNGLPEGCETAEKAWANGWVLRFDYKTLAEFVPISGITEGMLPTQVPEQIQHTVYTCYRFADSQKERNKLRRNPVYDENIPDDLLKEWDDYFNKNDSYPVGMDLYSGYSGVYRLSDIRVWSENTGDFVDQTGAITPEDERGYDDSLYVNIPVSAVPTQLAEITLGADGPISYKDNLNDKKQSTPVRLFYAVGLTEDLILRDAVGKQTGVDVSKISGEYIATHSDPTTSNIYFVSNWYSNTPYRGYTSDAAEEYRTRGDAAVSFSPAAENRYYLFQKPLPLIAHAYRVKDAVGHVAPVDRTTEQSWKANGAGNDKTTWENGENGANWSGGEFIGTYTDEKAFMKALQDNIQQIGNVRYITDEKGYSYPLPDDITDAVITYTKDQLSKVDSDADGNYTEGSNSFASDDYFFLCIEYYLPMEGTGKDVQGNEVIGTHAVRKVNRMIARKGSAFGSGLHSENIDNGDMLCWTDINGNCTLELEYNSRSDTLDNTRGRPTLEKLTYTEEDLRAYLRDQCKLDARENVEIKDPATGETRTTSYLELDVAYWLGVQADSHMRTLIEDIMATENPQTRFDELFDWSVAARTGGIRVGDMFNNMQAKGGGDLIDGYYADNKTKTANNYYIPTLSEESTSGDGLIINNFLGNNGRLEVANANLMVTKTLMAPDGFTLTEEQQNEIFNYQVYVQGLTGERLAQRLKWNPFSQSWQKRVETLDILTDNASLLVDTNGSRALFCYESGAPRQIAEVYEDGVAKYYYADATGAATKEPCTHSQEDFYYLYLPNSAGELNYPLFASTYEKGTTGLTGVGTTAYYPAKMDTSELPAGDNGNQTFAQEITGSADPLADRPAGSREYWTKEAELIPYEEVQKAESSGTEVEGSSRWDHEENHGAFEKHQQLEKFVLVTVIPDPEGTDSTVYSPFSSRTQYMTMPLYFGYTADLAKHLETQNETFATCGELAKYELKGTDLYDQIIPTVDRPTLFNNTSINDTPAKNNDTPDKVAKSTAAFTLKNGEGLLLTGLGNRITYRFTEKLTDKQIANGYTLKEISHVQQRDSDTVYVPGVQEIQVEGKSEPFAHTNATIWESYATMAAGALGNHHQPQASPGAEQNPSCLKQLDDGGCDLLQPDGSTRHYFYYGGNLVDPHYTGEQDGMSRYVLNPTAHFGVAGETQEGITTDPAKNPDNGYYNYTGVYSIYGDTGYFSEKANYTNTIDPELLVLTKEIHDTSNNRVDAPINQEFDFTLTLEKMDGTLPTDTTLYMWKGTKTYTDTGVTLTSKLTWEDTKGNIHSMPATAPALDQYQNFLSGDEMLQPVTPVADGKYTVKLKANEAAVFYGMFNGQKFTFNETEIEKYPAKDNTVEISKNVTRSQMNPAEIQPTTLTQNRADFVNLLQGATLTVEKYIHDDDRWSVTESFGFTVTLTAAEGESLDSSLLAVMKISTTKEGEETSVPLTETWKETKDGEKVTALTLTFELKHGERVVINGIPYNTEYKVAESDTAGYHLEHVADNSSDEPGSDGNYLEIERTDNSASGTVSDDNKAVYLLFNNAKPLAMPFTGGIGRDMFFIIGAALIISGIIFMCFSKKRRVRVK